MDQAFLKQLQREHDFRENYGRHVAAAADHIRPHLKEQPQVGLVLGSCLGDLADEIKGDTVIPYSQIPGFPVPKAGGHKGNMHIGTMSDVPIIGLAGRTHFYDVADQANPILQVVFSVDVLAELGVPVYFATNAAGGLNYAFRPGDMLVIDSHMSKIPNGTLGSQHGLKRVDGDETWRFQPMHDAYDPKLTDMLEATAEPHFNRVHRGTYMAMTGPTYETRAEVLDLRRRGADTVGMSTVPEIQRARNRGMQCVAFSCVTNVTAKDGTNATNHEEVMAALNDPATQAAFSNSVRGFFEAYRAAYID